MKYYLIAAFAAFGIFAQNSSAGILNDIVGNWKFNYVVYNNNNWKIGELSGNIKVSQLAKDSFLMATTHNELVYDLGEKKSISATINLWMFPNGETAGYENVNGEFSVNQGTWKVSKNKILYKETNFSSGEEPSTVEYTITQKSSKKYYYSVDLRDGVKVKGYIKK